MRAALLFVLAAGCAFTPGVAIDGGGSGSGSDAKQPDGPPVCVSFSSQLDTCAFSSTTDLTLTGMNTYDTNTGMLAMGATPIAVTHMSLANFDAIIVRNFHMTANATLRATGTLPIAIIAFGTVTIDMNALLDVSDGGAGARTSCPINAGAGATDTAGAAGGGGGGFGASGGRGGDGNSDGTHSVGGTAGPAILAPPSPLGGCPGGKGGDGDDPGGAAGVAGGAIYIASAARVELMTGAGINAGGGGGKGGNQSGAFSNGDAGGGGGASGGYIGLEAKVIRSAGTLAANGGGGGGGSGGGRAGSTGQPGQLSAAAATGGGVNGGTGAPGAAGGAKTPPAGATPGTINQGGGGGGGGGAGFVIVTSTDAQLATVSP